MKKRIRILIVDDSAFMRKSLSILIGSDPDFDIVGQAKNGQEGYDLAKRLRPDVITMDIEMPVMDGLTALKKIMDDCPTAVIMVSSLTTEGADATMKALELGALDFIPKEMSYINVKIASIKDDLLRKIKTIAHQAQIKNTLARLQTLKGKRTTTGVAAAPARTAATLSRIPRLPYRAIALGVSTGGPLSLQKVIPALDGSIALPMFIVQHMPPKFTKSLSDRLNDMSSLTVKEAEDDEPVKKGFVYIAPGGFHMTLKGGAATPRIRISEEPANTLHRPSVDVMMNSVIDAYGKNTLGIIMTGMGKDGLEGIRKLKQLGGNVLAQDEDTCVVYGMPKAIVDAGLADSVVPLDKIADSINAMVK